MKYYWNNLAIVHRMFLQADKVCLLLFLGLVILEGLACLCLVFTSPLLAENLLSDSLGSLLVDDTLVLTLSLGIVLLRTLVVLLLDIILVDS